MTTGHSEGSGNEVVRQLLVQTRDVLRTRIALIIAVGMSAVALMMATLVLVIIAQQAATANYRTVEATVVHADTNQYEPPSIRYRYKVVGDEYLGTRIRAGAIGTDLTDIEDAAFIRKLTKGDTIEVFYDAREPSRSVMRRGIDHRLWIVLLGQAPYWTLVIGFWLAIRWARRTHSA
ncbi:MAG: DUF3592 domain-containing protein [Phycisphaerales bacterium]